MRVTAWSNGHSLPSGAGYGVRLACRDRDEYFDPGWREVLIDLDGDEVKVPLPNSFWRSCPELHSAAIGRWLLHESLAPWPHRKPPVLLLRHVTANRFQLGPLP